MDPNRFAYHYYNALSIAINILMFATRRSDTNLPIEYHTVSGMIFLQVTCVSHLLYNKQISKSFILPSSYFVALWRDDTQHSL